MAAWTERSAGYKLGVLVLFLASALYLIGYASPFWYQSGSSFKGLWLVCGRVTTRRSSSLGSFSSTYISTRTKCYLVKGEASWYKAVQAFESIGLIGVFISCLYAFVVNCCQRAPQHNRLLEILSGASGVSGFIGTMIFVGKSDRFLSKIFGWAFGLNLTACLLLMVVAIVIALANKDVLTSPAPGGGGGGGAAVTYAQGMNVAYSPAGPQQPGQMYPPAGPQQQPGQMYPPAGPQGYVIQQPGYVGQPQGYSGAVMYPGPPQAGYAAAATPQYSAYTHTHSQGDGPAVPEEPK